MSALEELASDADASLAAGDLDGLARSQERSAPLVAQLGARCAGAADDVMRRRAAAWLQRRQDIERRVEQELTRIHQQIQEIDAARRRLSRVAPAYGRAPGSRRLCEVG